MWEERIAKAKAAGPVALIGLARETLEAWADTARIAWTQTGSEGQHNLLTNYSALAYALREAEKTVADLLEAAQEIASNRCDLPPTWAELGVAPATRGGRSE